MKSLNGAAVVAAWGALAAANGTSDDNCRWSTLGSGMNGVVRALAVFDDGSGPALYAGGEFTTADDVIVNHVAKWDGSAWRPVGGGTNARVFVLTVFDDGSGPTLFAGGDFSNAGGVPATGLARWDGDSWSQVGGGVNGGVRVLHAVYDGTDNVLYVGGDFSTAGGTVAASRIAAWSGSDWSALGAGVNGLVTGLATFDDGTGEALYVGGNFTTAGSVPANKVARWNGRSWSPLGTGLTGSYDWAGAVLTTYATPAGEESLYAGGWFSHAGGVLASRVARWDGQQWLSLGSGLIGQNTHVEAFQAFNDGDGVALFAVGGFSIVPSTPRDNIARWRDGAWTPVGEGLGGAFASCAAMFDDGTGSALYVGGDFDLAGGRPAHRIAKFGPFCDCNANGIADAEDIAIGTSIDCDGSGVPDECELTAVYESPLHIPFNAAHPQSFSIDSPPPAFGPVSLDVSVRGQLQGLTRFVTVRIDGATAGTLFITDGDECPIYPHDRTIAVSAEAFNLYRSDGSVIIELIPSGPVGECVQSFARVRLEYSTLPDCDSNGTWDGCQLASDPNVDCNANGVLDSCERYTPGSRDCNGNGLFDECEIASVPSLDKNGDGIIDACNYACGDFTLDGVVDGADLSVLLSLWGSKSPAIGDLTGDGTVDGADLAQLLGSWGECP